MSATDEWAGMKTQCPKCGIELIIPSPTDTEVAEAVEEDELAEEPKRNPITLKGNKTMPKAETKPVESKTYDEVINETNFLLEVLERSRKTMCVLVVVLSALFCVMGIVGGFAGAGVGGVVISGASVVLGCVAYEWICMIYRLKRVLPLLFLGIYKNTKKAE